MRGSFRKVLGFGLLGLMLALPAIMAQPGQGKKGGRGGGASHGKGKAGKKAPTKGGGRGGNS
jgi:hypothetical protein